MAWDVIESKRNGTGADGIEEAIEDWEADENPSSIDYIDTLEMGPDRVSIQIVYTE